MNLSEKATQSLQKVITQFQENDLSPITRVLSLQLPQDAPARNWTLSNQVLAAAQTHSLDCRGFQQWKEVGRQVKKGARAGFILYPKTYTKENDKGEKETHLAGFGTVPVFGVDDTEGAEIAAYTPRALPPLMDVAMILGINVAYTPMFGALGYCTTDNRKIALGTHDEAVFFHELAHALHNLFEKSQGGQDPHRETVAELTAAVLMQLYGVRDHTGNAWQYISSYNADPLKAITMALGDVEKVLNKLFELLGI